MQIIDFSRYMPGPLASRILLDLGAQVIKVENPVGGDANRGAPPYVNGEALFQVALNAGARSVAMSARDPRWPALVEGLVKGADAVIVGGQELALAKLGLGYDRLTAINPRLVWCNVTGYGEVGPWRDLPSHGLNPDAFAGLVPLEWTDGIPDPHGDYQSAGAPLSGIFAALGILGALRRRDETGQPQRVHTSMFNSAIWWNWRHVTTLANTGEMWWRYKDFGGRYATYRCQDDDVVLVCPIERHFWQRFVDLLGLPAEWRDKGSWAETVMDHGYNYPDERDIIAERMATRPRDEWLTEFQRISIPFAPILSPAEAIESEHARANHALREIIANGKKARIPGFPVQFGRDPQVDAVLRTPALGEHTAAVLAELSLSSQTRQDAG
ncbi:CoA transferase [Szabonella alba]|uniref:CoA transferase n=1 Tax=Szabonella alba TaxID=2804194 RepID=A0A8K0VBN9_9RHOB|nr:CoA transferase [Szabonella alba]